MEDNLKWTNFLKTDFGEIFCKNNVEYCNRGCTLGEIKFCLAKDSDEEITRLKKAREKIESAVKKKNDLAMILSLMGNELIEDKNKLENHMHVADSLITRLNKELINQEKKNSVDENLISEFVEKCKNANIILIRDSDGIHFERGGYIIGFEKPKFGTIYSNGDIWKSCYKNDVTANINDPDVQLIKIKVGKTIYSTELKCFKVEDFINNKKIIDIIDDKLNHVRFDAIVTTTDLIWKSLEMDKSLTFGDPVLRERYDNGKYLKPSYHCSWEYRIHTLEKKYEMSLPNSV